MEIVPSVKKRRRVGPFSKRLSFAALDLRTREGSFAAGIVEALYEQLGREPSPGQQIVVQQTALKLLRCEKMLPRILSGDITGHPEAQYLCWANSIRRDLLALGLLADAPAQRKSLADTLREIAAREAAD